ncbi:MAG: 23S rRNA (pseudouridine(1915)-N(3))-methyltransferase RlmH [Chitinophagales bacterium]
MQLHLLITGKTADPAVNAIVLDFAKRIPHYYPFELEIIDSNPGKTQDRDKMKSAEGDQMLKRFKPGDYIVLLDERGKQWSSTEFADAITNWANQSKKRIVFVIGGAFGFSDVVKQKSDIQLSLSKMTFSHQIVRALFLEQLYRACTIIRGEPYHHRG